MKDFLNDWGITLMVFLPLVGALVMMLIPKAEEELHKVVALASTLAVAVFGALLTIYFDWDRTGELQFAVDKSWIDVINSRYTMGVDGISMPLILLTLLVVPLVIITAGTTSPSRTTPRLSSSSSWCCTPACWAASWPKTSSCSSCSSRSCCCPCTS